MVHCLTSLQVLNNPIHPIHDSLIAWAGNLVEYKLPATIAFDPSWIIPGNSTPLANIYNFDSAVVTLDPIQALVLPPTVTHTHKRIDVPDAA